MTTPVMMAGPDDALALILEHARSRLSPVIQLPGLGAHGLRLADPVRARVSQPPADVSAMDGYAVRFEDANVGARLEIRGESRAGEPWSGDRIGPHQAVRIFTGAYVPSGADHILIQEDAERDGDAVSIRAPQPRPSSIRRKGLDFNDGDILVPAGERVTPGALALIAAGNVAEISVRAAPRIGVLATGDELKPAGQNLVPGQIVNSIAPALLALISTWGGAPVDLGIARDTLDDVRSRLEADVDVVVSIGGASVGDYDVVQPAFAAAGYLPVFRKLRIKPGKPTWFSCAPERLALGLPGNPAAALVTAQLFLRPLVLALSGAIDPGWTLTRARLISPIPATGDREEFLRAVASHDADGQLQVQPADNQDSSLINPFLSSNALIRRPPGSPAAQSGSSVESLLLVSA